MQTTFVFGHFSSSTLREVHSQLIVPSPTNPPTLVGHAGSVNPDSRIGRAVHSIQSSSTVSQITVPSLTRAPSVVGQLGSTTPETPAASCTAR